jgi:MEDS: MEthanogen/methylotroph, DcmR Sensory domain
LNEPLVDRPISEFLESLTQKKDQHLLLFHEQPEFGRMVEFQFLKIGLERGETSVYLVVDQDTLSVQKEMMDFGIEVDKFTSNGTLRIVQVQDPLLNSNGVRAGIMAAFQTALENVKPPYRVTDRLFQTSLNRMKANIAKEIVETERSFHESLHGQNECASTYLCSYPLDDIVKLLSDSPDISAGMLKNHHAVIYSTFRASLALHLD